MNADETLITIAPTKPVRQGIDHLIATGLWGLNPRDCVERIVERFLEKEVFERPLIKLESRRPRGSK